MKNMAHIAVCFGLLFSSSRAADPPALQGFSMDAATSERAWESKLKAIPSAARLREYMERLSARPHHVGSPYDKENAEWILSKFKEWGLEAQIENFDVLFPTPRERAVELVEPTRFIAKLEEPPVAGIRRPISRANNCQSTTHIPLMVMSLRRSYT
jgi:N-acetylated-alpha-linked acidic dipeptidase